MRRAQHLKKTESGLYTHTHAHTQRQAVLFGTYNHPFDIKWGKRIEKRERERRIPSPQNGNDGRDPEEPDSDECVTHGKRQRERPLLHAQYCLFFLLYLHFCLLLFLSFLANDGYLLFFFFFFVF